MIGCSVALVIELMITGYIVEVLGMLLNKGESSSVCCCRVGGEYHLV